MSDPLIAARVGDPVSHSATLGLALGGIAVGLVIGAVVVALTIASLGADAAVAAVVVAVANAISFACVGVSAGFLVGKLIGWATSALGWLDSKTGTITSGAATVFIGPGSPAAARRGDPVQCQEPASTYVGASILGSILCPGIGSIIALAIVYANSEHAGAKIAEGSLSVITEGKLQARVTDRTTCAAKISDGCHTVLIGGPTAVLESLNQYSEIPGWLTETVTWIDRIGVAAGLIGGVVGAFAKRAFVELAFVVGDVVLWAAETTFHVLGWEHAEENTAYVRTAYEVFLLGRAGVQSRSEIAENARRAEETAARARVPATPPREIPPVTPQKLLTGPAPQKLLPAPTPQKLLTGPAPQKLLPAPAPQKLLPAPTPQLLLTDGRLPGKG
jgi:uncharacterized Zn-binding protein involved in type VI secretion